jgi:hypothetical protein
MQDRDIDELQRIWDLKEKGAISESEFDQLKAKILSERIVTGEGSAAADHDPVAAATRSPTPASPSGSRAGAGKIIGISCAALLALVILIGIAGSGKAPTDANTTQNPDTSGDTNSASIDTNATGVTTDKNDATTSAWSYSQDEDKVRGGTTYYASVTSTNSIPQEAPYDSDTTMRMAVRKSPAYGTDVILTISSGQMMCPSFEGCSGTVRFDNGPPQHIRFNGPADDSSDTVFVVGAKAFIAKLRSAKKVMIEKTLYQAGNPQFEFDVHDFKWDH